MITQIADQIAVFGGCMLVSVFHTDLVARMMQETSRHG